jgi:diguanylate cyclase (GGDEF)-like protein
MSFSEKMGLLDGSFWHDPTHPPSELLRLLQQDAFYASFQPIADLKNGAVYAHEALIRGPVSSSLQSADTILMVAQKCGFLYEFEIHCVLRALRQWGQLKQHGRLFVNISANALVQGVQIVGIQHLSKLAKSLGVIPRQIVLELTEHERVIDMDELSKVVKALQSFGFSVALDDFGDGRSSLRLWSQIKPMMVKVDKYFSRDISSRPDNFKTIKALMQIAEVFDTALVAEGIETGDDLRVFRDLGIAYGQGFFLGKPDAVAVQTITKPARDVLVNSRVAVLPEHPYSARHGQLKHLSMVQAPTVTVHTTIDEVADVFLARSDLHALAVVEGDRPIGIINRNVFINRYATLFFREIFGKKSCMQCANTEPRLIERNHDVEELVGILTSQDQRYLNDGFVVVDNGRYLGLGTGEQLVRSVTELRIEAARHANPLTFLPGNIPISLHIKRLLNSGAWFSACYLDLNHFKPFNDHFGYWRGDEMIRLLAKIAVKNCDPHKDFVGHVGGDDFLILYQSQDWKNRALLIIQEFEDLSLALYDDESLQKGGIEGEDRDGLKRFFKFTSLSIGAVVVDKGQLATPEDVANRAAVAKHSAKQGGSGLHVISAL